MAGDVDHVDCGLYVASVRESTEKDIVSRFFCSR